MTTAKRESYEDVLKDLKTERDDLQTQVEKLNNAIGFIESRRKNAIESQSTIFPESEVPLFKNNAFKDLKVEQAAIKYLEKVGKGLTTQKVIDGVLKYGYKTDAKYPRNVVRNMMIEKAKAGTSELQRTPENIWYLKSWDWFKKENHSENENPSD